MLEISGPRFGDDLGHGYSKKGGERERIPTQSNGKLRDLNTILREFSGVLR